MIMLLLAGLAAFAESALGVGLVLPGETAIVALASMTSTHDILPMILAVALGATCGDHAGFLTGRRFGPRLEHSRVIRWTGVDRWHRATDMLNRRGGLALLISRMLPVVRTVMPAAAGAAGLGYRRFVGASIAGSLLWASLWVTAGSTLGALGELLSATVLTVLVVAVALTLVVLAGRRLYAARPGAVPVPASNPPPVAHLGISARQLPAHAGPRTQ